MRKRYLILLLLLFQFVFVSGSDKSAVPFQSSSSVSHVFPLNVVFVGFSEEVVDVNLINGNIQQDFSFDYSNATFNYSFTVSYHFASSSYHEELKAFILSNSVNGTGTTSALNVTALEVQKATGTRMSIFEPQSGRAINAVAVEHWFSANPFIGGLAPAYWFYVLNFTEFDSHNHSLEHWYNATELDFEADSLRDCWRLEWDNALNPDVKFPYACFTSQSRVFFIDPSAFQWYLTWARVWWGLSVSGPKYDYYYEDLDEFLSTHDVGTNPGKIGLAYYLAGWIDDALANLLAPELWTSAEISKAKSLSIQALILNNASDQGYSNEVMSWIINSTLAEEAISDLAPFLSVQVAVEFRNLSDCPQLKTIFRNALVEQTNGWTYYDGMQVFLDLYDVKDSYFNISSADVVINGYVYLEKNMSMMVYGGEYTGLGGMGQILVMKDVGRYFREDGSSPKSGLGMVFIHEAGHNLGFPHTFLTGAMHAGDFAFDVMGYYPYSDHFTQLRKDCFRRLVVDQRTLGLQKLLEEHSALYGRKPSIPAIDGEFEHIHAKINETNQLYEELRFLEAYSKNSEAEALEPPLHDLIWIYLSDLTSNGIVDIFDIVIIALAYGSQPWDGNWSPDGDLIQD
ncbi:MAG: hypothetical protein NWE81_00805, partial [Candidatus Bathyarchaeota archaeon]|nr:hypothetical protein [Candidatus Bathyarchaeota archaeon]